MKRLTRLATTARQYVPALIAAIPMIWLLLLFVLPLLFVVKMSLSEARLGLPPYYDLIRSIEDGIVTIQINFSNYMILAQDSLYVSALLGSLKIATVSTLLCILIGYPMAYAIANAPRHWRTPLLMLVILPFWTSFLIRAYAWIGILKNNGLLNNMLMSIGVIDEPLNILYTQWAVFIGDTYTYLPFFILPLYASLLKLDHSLLEAAADLGAKPITQFFTVTLPQTTPGIIAGSMLVFIPTMGEFIIPDLLGGPDVLMLGKMMWIEFFNNKDWPVASALTVVLLVALIIPFVLMQNYEQLDHGDNDR
ncbi:ABC transporter permease subunit [Neptuniibacter sp. CAU 1671]|uniref:ABC transporter permease subunit n=1 Tax=Neptuniibacter sp. CAU 1671 TaxID=3032593 RepID=UPI0023DCD8B2|nr:ABC transporter permease subunit [Neptuniibacter sp. CAU 1671]MDF2182837.1 ABC transporter permease subunit [Neptuniibacter sp. CAU 1671]